MTIRRLPLWWLITATAVALVAAGVIVLIFGKAEPENTSTTRSGDGYDVAAQGEIPASTHAIVLGSLDDEPDRTLHTLMDGKPMVLNFFASWCQPCLEEMPAFERVHQDLGEQITFVGLAVRDDPDKAKDTIAKTGVTYRSFMDKGDGALNYFESTGMPTTVFLDSAGEYVEMETGELSEDELRNKIRDLYGVG